ISIGPRTFIGSNSTILKGAKIGSDCIIGASSVVVGDIPDRCVAAGVPARVVRCRS
ncbi:MAG: acyltransferase, partial [Actinobacteria bacterium]|nr:acyltransferase [Actinomycetota bacterium]